jgi:Amt family ammonium transporter
MAHMLKGSAGVLAANDLAASAERLEELGRRSQRENIQEAIADVAAEIERCLEYLPLVKEKLAAPGEQPATTS